MAANSLFSSSWRRVAELNKKLRAPSASRRSLMWLRCSLATRPARRACTRLESGSSATSTSSRRRPSIGAWCMTWTCSTRTRRSGSSARYLWRGTWARPDAHNEPEVLADNEPEKTTQFSNGHARRRDINGSKDAYSRTDIAVPGGRLIIINDSTTPWNTTTTTEKERSRMDTCLRNDDA